MLRFSSTYAEFCHGHEPPLLIARKDLQPDYVYSMIFNGVAPPNPYRPGVWYSPMRKYESWSNTSSFWAIRS